MRILLLSYYFTPDLSAGSFRSQSLVKSFIKKNHENLKVDIITTFPNHYSSYNVETKEYEEIDNIKIFRISVPQHSSGFFDRAISFLYYATGVLKLSRKRNWDIVFATSGRLMTAFIGALISKKKKIPLNLDIRDLFLDTLKSIDSNILIRYLCIPLLKIVEKFTFQHADHINMVSRGFKKYVQKFNKNQTYSFYHNGIDDEFIGKNFKIKNKMRSKPLIIYAGNIGLSQDLGSMFPTLSRKLKNRAKFLIIGDGPQKKIIEKKLTETDNNLELIAPLNRQKLIEHYKNADILMLNLSDREAFKKVIPSKLYEYAATGKPILCGLSGHSKIFVNKNVPGSFIFVPTKIKSFIKAFEKLKSSRTIYSRKQFITDFSRKKIMSSMADSIINTLNKTNKKF